MRTMMRGVRRGSRAVTLALGLGAATLLAGCGDWLEVTNPGAVENPALENPDYIQLLIDGVYGDFQPALAWTALFSGAFTDELRMHHTYYENYEIDERVVTENNGTYALSVYNGLHRARFMADTTAGRMRKMLGDTVTNDLRYAKALAISGYSYTLLAEQICETRINGQGETLQPDALFAEAVKRFDAAIDAAPKAKAAAAAITNATVRARVQAGADSVLNLARVGAARASLGLSAYTGQAAATAAVSYARAVTPAYAGPNSLGFRYDAYFVNSSSRRRTGNPFWEFVSAGGSWVTINAPFLLRNADGTASTDPRVPHGRPGLRSVSGGGSWYVPESPRSFSTYNGTTTGAPFTRESSLRIGSAIEARYIIAEVEGNTPANVAFLNEQRAIGGDAPLVNPDQATYRAALREQRAREFFIDGHRLGDLRRYEKAHKVDLWETGPMYGNAARPFGTQKCFPTPISELY